VGGCPLEFSAFSPSGIQAKEWLTTGINPLPSNRPLLIAVWVTVTPIPVVILHSVMLPMVLAITPVLYCQVSPVSSVFVVVPVMVITVVPIVDSDLDAAVLRSRVGHDCGGCSYGSSQEH
jgi:hypothetical protein